MFLPANFLLPLSVVSKSEARGMEAAFVPTQDRDAKLADVFLLLQQTQSATYIVVASFAVRYTFIVFM